MTVAVVGTEVDLVAVAALLISVYALYRSLKRDRIAVVVETTWGDAVNLAPTITNAKIQRPESLLVVIRNQGQRVTTIESIALRGWDWRQPFRHRWAVAVPLAETSRIPYRLDPADRYDVLYDAASIDEHVKAWKDVVIAVQVVGTKRLVTARLRHRPPAGRNGRN